MARIETEYLEQLLNAAALTFEDNKVLLNYDTNSFLISALYDGVSDEVEFIDAYISDIGLNLTVEQEDLIGLHLENSYYNNKEINDDLNKEFLEDLDFECLKDNKNNL